MYVLWHELAHYFLHVQPHANGVRWFQLKPNTREEFEAEAFAVIALIPEPLLRRMLTWEIEEKERLNSARIRQPLGLGTFYLIFATPDAVNRTVAAEFYLKHD